LEDEEQEVTPINSEKILIQLKNEELKLRYRKLVESVYNQFYSMASISDDIENP